MSLPLTRPFSPSPPRFLTFPSSPQSHPNVFLDTYLYPTITVIIYKKYVITPNIIAVKNNASKISKRFPPPPVIQKSHSFIYYWITKSITWLGSARGVTNIRLREVSRQPFPALRNRIVEIPFAGFWWATAGVKFSVAKIFQTTSRHSLGVRTITIHVMLVFA